MDRMAVYGGCCGSFLSFFSRREKRLPSHNELSAPGLQWLAQPESRERFSFCILLGMGIGLCDGVLLACFMCLSHDSQE